MRGMHTVAPALAVVVAAATWGPGAAAAGPRREGKVVRVPRPPVTLPAAVHVCSLYEDGATCDRPVAPGEVAIVIDDVSNRGPATVRLAAPVRDGCGTTLQWKLGLELANGDELPGSGLVVFGLPLDDAARRLDPGDPPRAGEQVLYVVDRDGDRDGDLRVTKFGCDERGELDASPRPGHHCVDYWMSLRGRWQRARSDRTAVCER